MSDAKTEGQAAEGQVEEQDDFASLLDQEFRPKSQEVKSNVETAVAFP